jgi:hypothetical protein
MDISKSTECIDDVPPPPPPPVKEMDANDQSTSIHEEYTATEGYATSLLTENFKCRAR